MLTTSIMGERVGHALEIDFVAIGGLLHAGVQEYFQIDCHTRLSRSIFKLTVARGGQEVFSN